MQWLLEYFNPINFIRTNKKYGKKKKKENAQNNAIQLIIYVFTR
jgi:hypothetical protein